MSYIKVIKNDIAPKDASVLQLRPWCVGIKKSFLLVSVGDKDLGTCLVW